MAMKVRVFADRSGLPCSRNTESVRNGRTTVERCFSAECGIAASVKTYIGIVMVDYSVRKLVGIHNAMQANGYKQKHIKDARHPILREKRLL